MAAASGTKPFRYPVTQPQYSSHRRRLAESNRCSIPLETAWLCGSCSSARPDHDFVTGPCPLDRGREDVRLRVSPLAQEVSHSSACARLRDPDRRGRGGARQSVTHRPVAARGACAAGRFAPVRGAVLADAGGVLVRVKVEPVRGRCRVARPLPVPAVDVRAHPVPAPFDLRPDGERARRGLVGAA